MTFAAPLFLLATLAASIPVVLHMINRRKAKELAFPTLRFLRVSVQKTRRRKRVHDVLLMLLRAAVLAALAVSLARPALTRLGSLWGGADTAVAIVLDNSASMGLVDQGQVRLRTALRATEQILDQLREGDEVALLITGGPSYPELGRLDHAHDKVHQWLLSWTNAPDETGGVSYQRADLSAKVDAARRLLAKSDAPNRQIYVITDMQRISWKAAADGKTDGPHPSPLPEGEGTEGAAVPIILVDCDRTPGPNVAVQNVSLGTAVPVTGLPIQVTVELFNASSVPQQPYVELAIDGGRQQGSPALAIEPGGRLTYDFAYTPRHGGPHHGEVRLVGRDASPLDDRRFFTFEVDQGVPVAIVRTRPHEIAALEDTYYLERALAPGRSGAGAIRTTILSADDLATSPLADFKVVYCVNLPAPTAETDQRLRAYVAGGGNLVWIGGDNVDPAAYNELDQQAEGELLPAPLGDVRTADSQQARDSWSIGWLDAEYPALARLVEPASLYRSVLVYRHVRIDAAAASGARVLARLDDGEPLLVERRVERGRVLLLGTSVELDWTNLPLRPIFLPLMVRMTFELAGVEPQSRSLLAGMPWTTALEGTARPSQVEIVRPGGEQIRRPAQDAQGKPLDEFRYDDTNEIGVYRLRMLGTSRPREVATAVNVDADEADPTKIARDELQTILAPAPVVFAEDPHDLSSTFAWLREGTSLWEPLLAAVLAALVFETLVSNRLGVKRERLDKS